VPAGTASSIKSKFEQKAAATEAEKTAVAPKQPAAPRAVAPKAAAKPPAPAKPAAPKPAAGKGPGASDKKGGASVGSIASKFSKPNVTSPAPSNAPQPAASSLAKKFEHRIDVEAKSAQQQKEKAFAPPKAAFGKKTTPKPNIPAGAAHAASAKLQAKAGTGTAPPKAAGSVEVQPSASAKNLKSTFEAKAAPTAEPQVARTGKKWTPPGGAEAGNAPAQPPPASEHVPLPAAEPEQHHAEAAAQEHPHEQHEQPHAAEAAPAAEEQQEHQPAAEEHQPPAEEQPVEAQQEHQPVEEQPQPVEEATHEQEPQQ